jgi:hypothetical protein
MNSDSEDAEPTEEPNAIIPGLLMTAEEDSEEQALHKQYVSSYLCYIDEAIF